MKLQFLGASQQVTGSCYYLKTAGLKLLIDCGLHQERATLGRNWDPFPIPPASLDYLLLTPVHLDHSGLIPKLVREGFSGKILATAATTGLLPDLGRIRHVHGRPDQAPSRSKYLPA